MAAGIQFGPGGPIEYVASLTPENTLDYDDVTPGSVINVRYAGSWPVARPTARTDITVWTEAPSSIGTPATWQSMAPSWLLVNDRFEIRDVISDVPPPPPPSTGSGYTDIYDNSYDNSYTPPPSTVPAGSYPDTYSNTY